MTNGPQTEVRVLPEYIPENLKAPFKVVLKDSARQTINLATGEVIKTTIPNVPGLLERVALTRLLHSKKLVGADIKFVRKALHIKASYLADMISISPEHLSRCESDDRLLSPGAEKFLRLSILLDRLKMPVEVESFCEESKKHQPLLKLYRDAIQRLQTLVREMSIVSVTSVEEELVFAFKTRKLDQASLFDSVTDDEVWSDNLLAEAA